MQANQISVTALVCGYTRAYHSANNTPKIFDDFMAARLYTPEEMSFFAKSVASLLSLYEPETTVSSSEESTALRRVMQVYNSSTILCRARFTEDSLDEAIAGGMTQYVILGAGMDTFTLRRPDLKDNLQVYEVDHPATQANKRERMERISPELPRNLHLVPVDFSTDDLQTALLRAGYQPDRPGFFSWLGVTYYLERQAIHTTWRTLSALCAPGSTLVFDYADLGAFSLGISSGREKATQFIARQSGETMKTGFDPDELEKELLRFGFDTREDLSPAEIEQRYFAKRNDLYHAFEFVHLLKAEKMIE
ncbi:MAG: class I SAM-dependent methyltransferase [Leptolinea sp.]|jgi:methyltransferase (TIGR00027 family)|nr:class I SAM-dependent methyltransferase [Leptolinea sp.]